MEQSLEKKSLSNQYPLHQKLSILQSQQSNFKCSSYNQANFICASFNCQKPGLMCGNLNCSCQQNHFTCKPVFLKRVFKSILKKRQDVPQSVKQSYKTLNQIFDKMIDDLSQIRSKFQIQYDYFGLMKQEIHFLELISQNKFDHLCGKIISEMQSTFEAEIQFTILSKDEIIKDFESKRKQFDILCDQIVKKYSKKDKNCIHNLFLDSNIIFQDQEKKLLNEWLCQTINNKNKKFQSKLLFRASQNDFKRDKFHQACDGIYDTIVVVKNQFDKIIGGYTHERWNHTHNHYDKDEKGVSFLFSMDLKQKYKCIKSDNSIRNHQNWGPMFGGGGDLYISDMADKNNNSYAGFPHSYNLQISNVNKYQGCQQTTILFAGVSNGNNFKVKQYEVFKIIGLSL